MMNTSSTQGARASAKSEFAATTPLQGESMRDRRVRLTTQILTIDVLLLSAASNARAQQSALSKSTMDIYGFAMLDFVHDFKTIDPQWFDTLRVTRLPSFDKEFGENNNTFAGVRQSRFG